MNRFRTALTSFLLAFGFAAGSVDSCCMLQQGFPGRIQQTGQQAIVLHRDGREELILRINYTLEGEKRPDRFAWIVTVPNEPDAYAVAEPTIFEDMWNWANPPAGDQLGDDARATDAKQGGLRLSPPVRVGPYQIQPIRAIGLEALDGLNRWLEADGFPTEDADHMAYFVENGFTFLCIKVIAADGDAALADSGGVPPLRLSFRSARPYYPLRFSSRQGVFDLTISMLTGVPLDFDASAPTLPRINAVNDLPRQRNAVVQQSGLPESLLKSCADSPLLAAGAPWSFNVIRTKETNRDNAIASWTEDVFFTCASAQSPALPAAPAPAPSRIREP